MVGRTRYCPCASHGFSPPALFILFLFHGVSAASAAGPSSPPLDTAQQTILTNLSRVVGNSRWNTTSHDPCDWSGVHCTRSASGSLSVVTNLTLRGFDISNATIFASICSLDTLLILDLSKNSIPSFPGQSFPSPCAMAAGLQNLNLSSNRISVSLASFSVFPKLEILDLSLNFFGGRVSNELKSLPKLRSLNLSSTRLTGNLSTTFDISLEELVLSDNQLTGSFPLGVFACTNLTRLDLSQNSLTGDVPDNFVKLSNLQTLILSGNNLTGPIPKSLSEVTTLSRFAANQNNLTGLIPTDITKHLKMLDLSYNKLNDSIPSDFLLPTGLQTVDLTGNMLVGSIPGNLSRSLYRLRLGGNRFDGNIPDSICDGRSLAYLELDANQLVGNMPSELGNCKSLSLLNLASNNLQGPVPDTFSNLDKLVVLKLQMNNLSGPIPSIFSGLEFLNTLNLSQNSFTGAIPSEIFQLHKLSTLDLHGNNVSGSIPISISSSHSLIELDLGNNALTGTIPTMPTTLSTALNLSHNYLSGPIPSNIESLSDLEILDLSHNNLSGEVPSSLGSLQSLTQLVISCNNLSGSIPTFRQSVEVNSTGNPYLGNGTGNGTNSKKRTHSVFFIILVIGGAFIGLCLVAAIVMFSMSKRIYRVKDEGSSAEEGAAQIINGHLITTNSIHTSAIEFMKVMEAVSEHHNIFLKTRFCTYYKAVMPNGSTYSVKRLNWSDKIFHIGSQEKFGHELEVLGKLSSSNVMVPLAYVLSEDNAYLLYEHLFKGTVFDFLHGGRSDVLDWTSRYSISLGVAQGLTFLHGCTQSVLLLDLSTRTIHLKSMNEPQIGDIELYKIIDPSKSTGSLSTIAGTVGYIPPEYAYTMRLTMAGNVYSFGVILLELLSGKPSVSDGIELSKWALSLSARPEEREQILDTRVSRTSIAVHSQMLSVLNVALSCVALSPDARPKMRNVLRMLFNAK